MKVQELIDILERYDGDDDVVFSYNYGDYWRNTVAQTPREVQYESAVYSDYHQMLKIVDEDSEYKDEQDSKEYVVIS